MFGNSISPPRVILSERDGAGMSDMKIARYLTKVIGPRVSGSFKEAEAVEFIRSEFQKLNLETEIQKFRYLGWRQEIKPSLSILSPFQKTLQVSPVAYTGSTPLEGVQGVLKFHGTFYLFPRLMELPKFALLDDQGETAAFVLVLPGNKSLAIPNPWLQIFQDPMVLISEEEFMPVRKAMERGEEVRVHLRSVGEYVKSFTSYNVIARIEGKSRDTIIIGGHHDSMEGSPGAIDNASGVEGIFRLAEKLLRAKRNYSFNLITWGGHEWGLFGSQYFVKDAKERGYLDQVRACLTLDVLGCGDYLWIWAGPSPFREKIESVLKKSGLMRKREIRFEDTLIGSDDWSFSGEKIPHAMFMDWPVNTLHLPTDVYEEIDREKVDFGVDVAFSLVEYFEKYGV
jgi:aminopeptidase YwaD